MNSFLQLNKQLATHYIHGIHYITEEKNTIRNIGEELIQLLGGLQRITSFEVD